MITYKNKFFQKLTSSPSWKNMKISSLFYHINTDENLHDIVQAAKIASMFFNFLHKIAQKKLQMRWRPAKHQTQCFVDIV